MGQCGRTLRSEIEDRTGKPKASTWSIISGGAIPGMAMPDYGAIACRRDEVKQVSGTSIWYFLLSEKKLLGFWLC